MSIADRVDDAFALMNAGRSDGALASVLMAVAGAGERRYPPKKFAMKDNARFSTYVVETLKAISEFGYETTLDIDSKDFGRALYKNYRCKLLHEGALPSGMIWDPTPLVNHRTTFLVGRTANGGFLLQGDWVGVLARVALAEEPPFRLPKQALIYSGGRQGWQVAEALCAESYFSPPMLDLFTSVLTVLQPEAARNASHQLLSDAMKHVAFIRWTPYHRIERYESWGWIDSERNLTVDGLRECKRLHAQVDWDAETAAL